MNFHSVIIRTYTDAKYDISTRFNGQLTTLTPVTYREPMAKSAFPKHCIVSLGHLIVREISIHFKNKIIFIL
jgi:hypothetical protein